MLSFIVNVPPSEVASRVHEYRNTPTSVDERLLRIYRELSFQCTSHVRLTTPMDSFAGALAGLCGWLRGSVYCYQTRYLYCNLASAWNRTNMKNRLHVRSFSNSPWSTNHREWNEYCRINCCVLENPLYSTMWLPNHGHTDTEISDNENERGSQIDDESRLWKEACSGYFGLILLDECELTTSQR